jgi:hypothetical protein
VRILSPDGGTRLRLLRLADGREHRRLIHRGPRGVSDYAGEFLLSGDDRLLALRAPSAIADTCNLALVDAGSGQRLATLPAASGTELRPLCYEPSGALLTYDGGYGLLRWPVRSEPGIVRRFCPPQRLLASPIGDLWGCSADGQVVAIPQYSKGALVGRPEKRERWLALQPQDDVRGCFVSPDGRLVVTCSWWCSPDRYGCKVWNAADGALIKELSLGGEGAVASFSPDGGWLANRIRSGVRLWRVKTWEEVPLLTDRAAGFAFGPDSGLIAVGGESGVVRLCVTETGRELARLEVPDATRLSPICFSHDSRQLFAFGEEDKAIHVWDLRRIRRQLAELGLDWDATPIEEPKPEADRRPQRVEVDLGDLAKFQIANLEKSLEQNPDQAEVCNALSRLYATGPAKLRDPAKAVLLARRAVKLKLNEWSYHNTLGVAYYRNGQYREAVRELETSLKGGAGRADAWDLFFLALCHSRLGDAVQAKDCFDRAVKWAQAQQNLPAHQLEELKAFRAEAEELLQKAPPPRPRSQ